MVRDRSARQRGFTLVEVVVALAILGLILAVIFRINSTGLTGMARADGQRRAAFVAEGLMAQLAATDKPLRPGDSLSGEVNGYRWRIVADPYPGASGRTAALGDKKMALARIRIGVESAVGARYEVTTLRLVPVK